MRREDSHDGQGQGGKAQHGGRGRVRQVSSVEMEGETGSVSQLPVFLFPSELVFYTEDRSSHRRVLTVYNPYSFTLSFKMWCTAPSLYRVLESEGSVRAKSCVDLVVRHLDVSPRNQGRKDRFLLEVRGGGQVGGREIWAQLRVGAAGAEEEEERRRKQGGKEERRSGGHQRVLPPQSPLLLPTHMQLPTGTAVRSVSQWVVCVVLAVLCVTVLMLPLHNNSSSAVPRCLHVSTNQKLVCAYTLGLLTMTFLR